MALNRCNVGKHGYGAMATEGSIITAISIQFQSWDIDE